MRLGTKPGDLIRAHCFDGKDFVYITVTGDSSYLSRLLHGEIVMVVEVLAGKPPERSPLVKFLYQDTICMGMADDFITLPCDPQPLWWK